MPAPVTALILTKNESAGIVRCIMAAQECCNQVIVADSGSTDGTQEIARSLGATVVNFQWNGAYPKKKQWAMELNQVQNDWVLHLDADEIVTAALAAEIADVISATPSEAAFDVRLSYRFAGKTLRYGHVVYKRSLVNRKITQFPAVPDLQAPGITEVEGHYQPDANGTVGRLRNRLWHDDPDPVSSWISRHNRYSDWEAYLRQQQTARREIRAHKSAQGKLFDYVPFKPAAFFFYSYIVRRGFLDGQAGFDYAFALAWYYWLISLKSREARSAEASKEGPR